MGEIMEHMIQKILELDREERSLTAQAELEKMETEQNIAAIKNELRESFLERARQRAAQNTQGERLEALAEWEKTKAQHDRIRARLDELYARNRDSLAESIVRNTLAGD